MSPKSGESAPPTRFPSELRELVEGLGAIVWQADARDWRFNWVSRNAEEVLGYPVEQWLTEPDFWINHIHPDDRENAIRICSTATARGENHAFEYRAIASDGRSVWLRDVVRVVPDDVGQPRELRGIMFDITEQKNAEKALRESEERFRQLAETIHEVFWVVDAATKRVLYVSPAYEEIWGRSCQTIYENPQSWRESVHLDDLPEINRAYEEKLYQGEPVLIEYRVIRPDGETRWIYGRSYAVKDAEGRIYRLVGIAEDITRRKEAEIVLREREARFRKVFEESPIGMAIVGENFRIVRANEALCALLGRTKEEMEAITFVEFTHGDDLDHCIDLTVRMFAGEIPSYRLDKRYLRPDGEVIWADVTASIVRSGDGSALYALAMAVDVTERHKAEDRLRELSGRLLRLQDEERRRIARELHDSTGQNLAALKLNLSYLNEAHFPAKLRSTVSDSLDLSEKMLREIRTLSYLLHPPLLDELGLDSAIRAYIAGFNDRSGIQVQFDDPPDLGRLGKDLEIAVFRIIQEALTNIHRHSGSKRGWVAIGVLAGEVRVEIRDEGIGLQAEALAAAERGYAGLGVGISGMRERARQLGGRLEIQSSSSGCIVLARFPLKDR